MAIRYEPHDLQTLKDAYFELTCGATPFVVELNDIEYPRYNAVDDYLNDVLNANMYDHTERQQRDIGEQGIRILKRYLSRKGATGPHYTIEALAPRGAQRVQELFGTLQEGNLLGMLEGLVRQMQQMGNDVGVIATVGDVASALDDALHESKEKFLLQKHLKYPN